MDTERIRGRPIIECISVFKVLKARRFYRRKFRGTQQVFVRWADVRKNLGVMWIRFISGVKSLA